MNTVPKNLHSLQEDIDRLVFQSKALVITLSAQDQFKSLTDETLSSALWLLNDRLNDIDQACQRLFEETAL
ncbi:hypothetical protein CS022_22420 [Veronia nyctiphanis]|uniref:Uncharacterized protein n=1 Tax=Veronia nyctiphanis TaxID=1278244 RepID=A0A4Q0YJ97_9GAMM|nr:hypothetical protein [Veronia nyctiphanis]RXJ70782.1 hypothetical protein CS022_22420 [Veronia nyctiphanis]